jgi:hypothetical protein
MRIACRIYRIATLAMICTGMAFPAAAQKDPRGLVTNVVDNELNAQKSDQFWIYRDDNHEDGKSKVQRVVETPECHLVWPLEIEGKPASEDDKAKAQQKMQELVTDDQARAKNRKEIQEDEDKANTLMKLLPDAFLFTRGAEQKGMLEVRFRPNPDYKPTSNEAKVFHSMAGILLIDMKEKRLAKISGKLVHEVDFGLGVLGKIHKGGTFTVVQKEVSQGDWEVTLLDVHISGRALFFHQIGTQQHEVMTEFKAVPKDIELKKAAELAKGES